MRATAPDRLPTGASQDNRQAPGGRTVGDGVVPAFVPKRNSVPIGPTVRTADDAASLEIGE
jgi:hypothetical protein